MPTDEQDIVSRVEKPAIGSVGIDRLVSATQCCPSDSVAQDMSGKSPAKFAPRDSKRFIQQGNGSLGLHDRRVILGVTIRGFSRRQAIATIDQALALGERLNVCFANAQALNIACDNEPFRSSLRRFLVLNDGLGANIASRIKFGKPFTENLNGTDFVPDFLATTGHRLRIYLVGTSDSAVERAAQEFRARYPHHTIVGWRNGFFPDAEDIEGTCSNIRATRADCVLVGMGNPLQELWIDKHGHKTGAKLLFGVGALLDFQAGHVRRAPRWVRHLHCEWVYRLVQEPRRLARRYLIGNFVFIGRVLIDARR